MKALLAVLALTVSAPAMAAGVVCDAPAGDLRVRLNLGENSVMVVSNPQISSDRKTIAKFTEEDGTLRVLNEYTAVAKVDRRFKNSRRGGELIAGTRLSEVKTINLLLSAVGESDGRVAIIKRNGTIKYVGLDCSDL
jgi:hypothetical protein